MDKKEQFISAIKDNEGFIYKLAHAYTNTPEDRHDLVQEIFYQLWKSFGSYAGKAALGTWIYRVALNVAIYQLRKNRKQVRVVPLNESTLELADSHSMQEENWKLFRQQIDELNLLDKGIVLLYLDNKTHEEIAAVTGLSKTNVGTRLARIKEKLKQEITKKYSHGTG